MAVKAVEMARKIRDRHYEKTKNLSIEEQVKFIKEKSIQLQRLLQRNEHPTTDKNTQVVNV
ncbi:MAG: hypothetical protein ABII68_12000 [Pseudomonadota bacterium]